MTPEEYLKRQGRLVQAGKFDEVMAFAYAHLTEEMLDEMTPQQRRLATSATHVAEQVLGGGGYGPPTGIPIDELIDAAS
jgi:hypothetical protein